MGIATMLRGMAMKRRRSTNGSSRRVRRRVTPRAGIRVRRRYPVRIVRRRRRYGGSANNNGGGREMRKINIKYGKRPRRNLRTAFKLIKNSNTTITTGKEISNNLGDANGAVRGYHGTDSLQYRVPVFLFPVTSCCNSDATGTIITPDTLYQVKFTSKNDTATVNFDSTPFLGSTLQDGVLNYPVVGGTANFLPHEKCILRWFALKLLFYGANDLANKIQIELISLTDDRLHPDAAFSSVQDLAFKCAFWQYMTKQFSRNPVSLMETRFRRYYKVHKRQTVYMDSKDTDQTVQNNQRLINFFCRLNRTCNYAVNDPDRTNMTVVDPQVNFGQNRTDTNFKSRLYILLRFNAIESTTDSFDRNKHPSFDFSTRKSHIVST